MIEEIWASREGLQRHLRSATFRNILLVVEMASQAPEIRFDRISHSTGIDTIEQARD
jgi:quinol monooxygenase YgiN